MEWNHLNDVLSKNGDYIDSHIAISNGRILCHTTTIFRLYLVVLLLYLTHYISLDTESRDENLSRTPLALPSPNLLTTIQSSVGVPDGVSVGLLPAIDG